MSEQFTPSTTRVANMYSFATAWELEPGDPWVRKMQASARAEFNRWLAAHDREVAERAWGEGFGKGTAHGIAYQAGDDEAWKRPPNPYRIESQETP